MNLTAQEHRAIAERLRAASASRTVIGRPTLEHPGLDMEDAYAIQLAWRDAEVAAGRRLAGRKVGLTSAVMRRATKVDQPDYGVFFADQVFPSGAELHASDFPNVRVEVEIAFELCSELEPPFTPSSVLAASCTVRPALEILASRIDLEGRTVLDTISDNAALGAVVLGAPVRASRVWDRHWEGAILERASGHHAAEIEETGLAAAVLGDPAASVAWLARTLAALGETPHAGEVIMSGSFVAPLWISAGDRVTARFTTLGEVSCRFS